MNTTEFVEKALRWQKLMAEAKALEKELEVPFRELFADKKQTIGLFEVEFDKGKTSFDYEATWHREYGKVFPDAEYIKTSYDYTKAVKDKKLEDVIVKKAPVGKVKFTYLGE